MNRYKITLSSNTVYKEIELAPDAQQVKVGTGVDCDIRLRKELFFGQIELLFVKNGKEWSVHCSDNLYLTVGDIRKLMTKNLVHGDVLEIKYENGILNLGNAQLKEQNKFRGIMQELFGQYKNEPKYILKLLRILL